MKEETHLQLLPRKIFLKRFSFNIVLGLGAILFALLLGMLGYRFFEKMSWVDAYVNAAMILSGMGPVKELTTEGGKIFAGTYALFSGIIFLVLIAFIFTPVIHRCFHKFHLEDKDQKF